MIKKLFVLFLAALLVCLPLLSQAPEAANKNCGCSNSKLNLMAVKIRNNRKLESSQPKKNYDRIFFTKSGKVSGMISKDKGKIKLIYNEYGRLTGKIKSNLEFEHHYYDKLGRKARIEYKAKGKKDVVEFKYSTTEESYELGNIVEKIERNEHSFYKYSGSRLKEEKKRIGGHEFVAKYDYNKKGLLSEIHYPSGLIVSYKYDDKNKIENIFITNGNTKQES